MVRYTTMAKKSVKNKELIPNKLDKAKNAGKGFWGWLKADKKRLIGAGVLVVALLFVLFRIRANAASKPSYQTSTVQKGTVVSTISASGKAISTSILPISTEASGIVSKVYVKDGDHVVKGQKIAAITLDTDGQKQYASALGSYLSSKNSLASANSGLYSQQSSEFSANQKFINDAVARNLDTTDPTYIQEYADWKAAEAKYLQQETSIQSAQQSFNSAAITLQESSPTITAPYTGTISDINLVEGMVITSSTNSSTGEVSSQRIAVIRNESTPIINVTLGETDVPNVKIGQKATVTFDSITDKTFTGTVATVDRIGTVSSNVTSYGVNIKLDSGSDQILPNMAATADIIIDTATDALYVPSSSLITQNGSTLAKTLQNGKEVDVTVEIGISSDTNTVITSGLSEGEKVITGTVSASSSTTSGSSVFSSTGRGGFSGGGNVRVFSGRGG